MTDLKETPREFEPKTGKYRVIFEPGRHILGKQEREDYYERLSSGDNFYNTSFWVNGDKIARRMSQYNPMYIAPDSVSAAYGSDFERERVWTHLPSNPSKINPKSKHIYVVSGDFFLGDISVSENKEISKQYVEQRNEAMDQVRIGIGQWEQSFPKTRVNEAAIPFAGGMTALLITAAGVTTVARAWSKKEQSLTRRQFLKLGTGYALTLGLSTLGLIKAFGEKFASASRTSEAKDFWLRVTDFNPPKNLGIDEVNARTAVAAMKCQDAMVLNNHPGATATVLMGESHSKLATRMSTDLSYSKEMAGKYFNLLSEIVHKLNIVEPVNGIPPDEIKRRIMEELRALVTDVHVYRVDEPAGDRDHKTGLSKDDVLENVNLVDSFQSPLVAKVWDAYTK